MSKVIQVSDIPKFKDKFPEHRDTPVTIEDVKEPAKEAREAREAREVKKAKKTKQDILNDI